MTVKVELIPVTEGNRITVKENDKVIVGRGSSLGCNEKKISRHHAELLLKDDHTLWIKPTHANPVFYRSLNGKIVQLTKDIERELKDGDQIGLLPSSFYFRVSFCADVNNNHDSNSDSSYTFKKEHDDSPVRAASPDQWSPTHGYRRSSAHQDTSVFDFDDDANFEPPVIPCKRPPPLEKKIIADVTEPKPSPPATAAPSISRAQVVISRPSIVEDEDEIESPTTDQRPRKLPKWMIAPTPSPVIKPTTTTPTSRNSSAVTPSTAKRHLSFEGDSNGEMNDSSNMSDIRSPATPSETKSPGKVLSKIPSTRSFDSDSGDGFESTTAKTPSTPNKIKSNGKHRSVCQFGASCYRKNPAHRAEQSHPGDSDYDETKANNETHTEDTDVDKPECPFGKACYRQNPQHKRDFKH